MFVWDMNPWQTNKQKGSLAQRITATYTSEQVGKASRHVLGCFVVVAGAKKVLQPFLLQMNGIFIF